MRKLRQFLDTMLWLTLGGSTFLFIWWYLDK